MNHLMPAAPSTSSNSSLTCHGCCLASYHMLEPATSAPEPATRSLPSKAFSSGTLCEGLELVERQQIKEEFPELVDMEIQAVGLGHIIYIFMHACIYTYTAYILVSRKLGVNTHIHACAVV